MPSCLTQSLVSLYNFYSSYICIYIIIIICINIYIIIYIFIEKDYHHYYYNFSPRRRRFRFLDRCHNKKPRVFITVLTYTLLFWAAVLLPALPKTRTWKQQHSVPLKLVNFLRPMHLLTYSYTFPEILTMEWLICSNMFKWSQRWSPPKQT